MPANNEYQNIFHNIRYLRKVFGLSRTVMARKLHISVKTLDALESCTVSAKLRIHFLLYIHKEFGVSPERLLRTRLDHKS